MILEFWWKIQNPIENKNDAIYYFVNGYMYIEIKVEPPNDRY